MRFLPGRRPVAVTAAAAASLASPVRTAAPKRTLATANDTFMHGGQAGYVEEMYEAWKQDPKSVHLSWQVYFRNMDGREAGAAPAPSAFVPPPMSTENAPLSWSGFAAKGGDQTALSDHMKVQSLVRAYQVRGHHLARLDPLEIKTPSNAAELDWRNYGFTEKDLERKISLGPTILPWFKGDREELTLREIVDALHATYCGTIGIEYGHIADRAACDWIRSRIEVPTKYRYTPEYKRMILDRLMWSTEFERFAAAKFPSVKRFGLEGCESLIPGMKSLIDRSVDAGVNSIVMGMAHRGRLNVLSNVVRKPNEGIFNEISGGHTDWSVEGSGDVKYHLGMNYVRPTPSGAMVHLSLAANPSHLEAANPVVAGKVRGLQFYQNDEAERSKAMAVTIHGDASFAGQGVVYETLGMMDLPGYTTGGTVHIIINNQIGFTTDPRYSRSTPYCSDVAKTVSAPILHVNGDDTEAVVYAMELAAEWRAKFKKDVVVDIVCYRRYGHNEIDQPSFTQPLMYQKIAKCPPVLEKYTAQLLKEGSITQDEVDGMRKRIIDILEDNYNASKTYKSSSKEWLSSTWTGFKSPAELAVECVKTYSTGVEADLLRHIGQAAASYPSDFKVHNALSRVLKAREKTISEGVGIDWATAESMSFGSLLAQGTHVRLSGQDVERGTFSQRHALLHDQKTERQYVPLNNLVVADIVPSQNKFTVSNSSLSEFGILGFELGYSMVHPNQLVLWEAQFGDFANNAQCIIDQFICSGEQKWLQRTGLTMLLPHGYDGQGPEHSSARLERYLALCDEDPYTMPDFEGQHRGSYARQHQDCNMAVVYPTVPSNYFHVLRRQVQRDFRKPLIVLASKALLRDNLAKSAMAEMGTGTRFQRLIPEVMHPNPLADMNTAQGNTTSGNNVEPRLPYHLIPDACPPAIVAADANYTHKSSVTDFALSSPAETETLIFCSGQVYYTLFKARQKNNLKNIAIVRLEQLNPFPFHEARVVIDAYPNLKEIVYCQEEPMNAGAWMHVQPRLETAAQATRWWRGEGDAASATPGRAWEAKLDRERTAGGLLNFRDEDNGSSYNGAKSVRGSRLIRYAGRDISAATATGLKKQHDWEERMFISEALFGGNLIKPVDGIYKA
ncbi:hypothetical protein CXG81DRAFT_12167 [Caulochytrium protostelioides]|uniref:2-oxoglutarate dehydrogenase, mitochondrial n=1 Tax=Caulochytrium protostelioides TaxID=1555241 RepID=A0A4P9X7V9_9FUNG|nr:2-oxoglutarate dehydrogenase, E1 component [Caulochytrium protostelioides]RKP01312.1 hypothetical protein CXG81DRAFT_12167 [Caulochytrium protostelioides]|eukprot:RKP01312.1 hypothetical protein CXG81DRAFT_12167 [Caulochytrium protostelioides]